jgi:endonuclease V-like protein UPF0215 family
VRISLPLEVEAVGFGRLRVDGRDATRAIIRLVRDPSVGAGARAVVLDGITFAGFNLADLDEIHRVLRLPVIAVTRRTPNYRKIEAALREYFPRTFAERWRLVRAHRLFRVPTPAEPIWAASSGCTAVEARALLRRATVRGFIPEPVRLAGIVARSYARARGAKR